MRDRRVVVRSTVTARHAFTVFSTLDSLLLIVVAIMR
jgi:hypothetical protein